jgi:cytochrome c oxidase assembly protein subunit 15
MPRTAQYQPALAWFAALGSAWVFVLVTMGAFTTTIGAGMVFADWPLSNGSVNPHGWLDDIAMFAEHSHRLTGAVMGLITIALALWLHLRESRAWLRRLGWWALGIVIVQGLIGGKRVLLDSLAVPGFEMTLGQMLRIPHGVLAQVYVCVLFAIAAGLSRPWIEGHGGLAGASRDTTRRLGFWCLFLLLTQLWIATAMRHNYAGMAIPWFPASNADGGLLPAQWDYRVVLHFSHRVMALILALVIPAYVVALWRESGVSPVLRAFGVVLIGLLALQIFLGAKIIWTGRSVYVTTGHVVCGALTLAIAFLAVFFAHRDAIEQPATPAA